MSGTLRDSGVSVMQYIGVASLVCCTASSLYVGGSGVLVLQGPGVAGLVCCTTGSSVSPGAGEAGLVCCTTSKGPVLRVLLV